MQIRVALLVDLRTKEAALRDLRGEEAKEKAMTSNESIRARLERLTDGLLNISESDSPVVVIHGKAPRGAPDAAYVGCEFGAIFEANSAAFAGGTRVGEDDKKPLAEQKVLETDAEEFFDNRSQAYDDGHLTLMRCNAWREIGDIMNNELTSMVAFRFGDIEVTYVIVARSGSELVGIMTGAVET